MTSSQGDLVDFFANLASEGTTEASGVGFTVESAKAREKLREFALAHPDSYQLLMVAGLYALGSRKFTVVIDADDLVVTGDHPIERRPFTDLWSYVSRGSTEASVIGYRLIALALLTSVRLDQMLWTIESSDSEGHWGCQFEVRGGEVSDGAILPQDALNTGVRLSSKRKALGQIARRYISRMLHSFQGRQQSEEKLLADRLFLPQGGRLEINGQLISKDNDGLEFSSVLAVLTSGEAPDLVSSQNVFRLKKDASVCVLLSDPRRTRDPSVPGFSNQVHWIWNGLLMDSTVLGSGLESFRAFVWAPLLRPDLSFTNLVDNRDKQTLERTVRDMARDLLKFYVLDLSEKIQGLPSTGPLDWEAPLAIVRSALAARIDLARDRKRLASLNRALIACPLCLGSGDDGQERWVAFSEIWERIANQEPVAIFAREKDWQAVPAWSGRPLVLRTTEVEAAFLKKVFGDHKFDDGKAIATQLLRMLQRASRNFADDAPSERTQEPSAFSGLARLDGVTIEWEISAESVQQALAGEPSTCQSSLQVSQAGHLVFIDRTLSLPPGTTVNAEAPWHPSYQEKLDDRNLATRISVTVLESLAQALAQRAEPVTDLDCAITSLLLRGLAKLGSAFSSSKSVVLQETAWLCVSDLKGTRGRISPRDLRVRLSKLQMPLYGAEYQEIVAQDLAVPPAWQELPIVLVLPSAGPTLKTLEAEAQDWKGLHSLLLREPPSWNEEEFVWTGTLAGPEAAWISNDLASVTLAVPRAGWSASKKSTLFASLVWRSLHGHALGSKTVELPISPSLVAVDWNSGWPDSGGLGRKTNAGPGKSKEQLIQACRRLAADFLTSAAPELLLAAHPQTVGSALFETLSEPSTAEACVLLLSNGQKVRMADVPNPGGLRCYFTRADLFGRVPEHAVFAPGPMAEALCLFSSIPWIEVRNSSPLAKPTEVPAPGATVPPTIAQLNSRLPSTPKFQQKSQPTSPPKAETRAMRPAVESAAKPQPVPTEISLPLPDGKQKKLAATILPPKPKTAPTVEPGPTAPREVPTQPQPERAQELAQELAQEVQLLITEALALTEGEDSTELVEFLRALTIDPAASQPLSEKDEAIVLGPQAVQATRSLDGRLVLLSALFSVFNRQRESITDSDERAFHARLLQRSLQLERGRSYP